MHWLVNLQARNNAKPTNLWSKADLPKKELIGLVVIKAKAKEKRKNENRRDALWFRVTPFCITT